MYRSGIGADRRVSELIGVVSELIGECIGADRRVSEGIGAYRRGIGECIGADRS